MFALLDEGGHKNNTLSLSSILCMVAGDLSIIIPVLIDPLFFCSVLLLFLYKKTKTSLYISFVELDDEFIHLHESCPLIICCTAVRDGLVGLQGVVQDVGTSARIILRGRAAEPMMSQAYRRSQDGASPESCTDSDCPKWKGRPYGTSTTAVNRICRPVGTPTPRIYKYHDTWPAR